jgi:hypothetical protein
MYEDMTPISSKLINRLKITKSDTSTDEDGGLCDTAQCSLVEGDRSFTGTYCLPHQDDESFIDLSRFEVFCPLTPFLPEDGSTMQFPKCCSCIIL